MLEINDRSRKWWILTAMGTCGGLIMLDETVVGVALPTLRRDLGMSDLASHWVISAYLLVFTGAAAASGKLGDVIGFKNLVIVGAAVFGLASLASGFAESGAFLIAACAVRGLGAAVIFPARFAMLIIAFPKEQRGMAIGILGAIGTTFLALGPLVGGFLTEIFSWRWIFWINIPIASLIVAIVLAAWEDPPRKGTHSSFDYAGLVTLAAGIGMLVFAIMQGSTWGWTQGIIPWLLAGGIALLSLFVLIELRRQVPLIEVRLFRSASFSACTLVFFVGQFSKMTIIVFGSLYLQDKLGMGPLIAGFALLAAVGGFPVFSAPAGLLADRIGARRPVLGGMALATLAMFWIGLTAGGDSYVLLLPGLILWGIGLPFCYAPATRAMANAVPTEKQGQIGGIAVTARLLGGTIGVAICSTLLIMTGDFQAVFLVTGAIMLAIFLFGWFAIEPGHGVLVPSAHHPTGAWSHS